MDFYSVMAIKAQLNVRMVSSQRHSNYGAHSDQIHQRSCPGY